MKENNMKTKMIDIVDLKQLVKEKKISFSVIYGQIICIDLGSGEVVVVGETNKG